MKDRINLTKGAMMKTVVISLITVITLFMSGCSQNETSTPNQKGTPNAEVDKVDLSKELQLHDAVRAKDMEQVKLLVSNKSDVNLKDQYGYSPLHLAVRLNQYEIGEYLIANGADVNNMDNYEDTPLLDSTRDDYTKLSKLLICNGAKRRVADRYDMTPLHYSAKNKNKLISEMLLAEDITPYCTQQEEKAATQQEPVVQESVQEAPAVEQEELPLAQTPEFKGLYEALTEEFKDDFEPWNAELTKDDLMFRFNDPATLFEKGSDQVKPEFAKILDDFFPRYLKVLSQYKDNIQEVRVEGHTSSEYSLAKNDDERYQFNKILSQKRADAVRDTSVQNVVFEKGSSELKPEVAQTINDPEINGAWIDEKVQSYGMAYDNLILNPDGTENKVSSRRVDFKIVKN